MDIKPLYEMNPLERFSDRAGNYVKYRPSYPQEAIACILEGWGDLSQLIAVDIGAGTGISARLLGDRNLRVIAIEPNAEMRQAAESHPLVEFRFGTATQTSLPDASVDLVTCFQAFHWFEPDASLWEFRRILKPSGRLALVWNLCDEADAFTAEYNRLIRQAANEPLAKERPSSEEPLFASPHFTDVRQYAFAYRQALDLTGLIGRANSTSYIPLEGAACEQLLVDLKQLYDTWADERGLIYLVYQTKVYLAMPTSADN